MQSFRNDTKIDTTRTHGVQDIEFFTISIQNPCYKACVMFECDVPLLRG